MAYSASRGLLYSAPPNADQNRRPDTEKNAADAESTTGSTPTPADD